MFRCAPDYILRKSKLRVLLRETLKGIIIEMILCWIFPDCYCAHGFSCRSVPILNWLLKAGHAILFSWRPSCLTCAMTFICFSCQIQTWRVFWYLFIKGESNFLPCSSAVSPMCCGEQWECNCLLHRPQSQPRSPSRVRLRQYFLLSTK